MSVSAECGATDVLMAGFGGQGMLLAGKVLALSSMAQNREVSWLPSYGPEMRGGTASVIVRVSPEPIGSPLVESPCALVAMNRPSLDKFAPKVRQGGLILANSSLISNDPDRPDCRVIRIASRELAIEAGSEQAANFVMLGAYVAASEVLPPTAVEQAILEEFTGPRERFAAANVAAFRAGVRRSGEEA